MSAKRGQFITVEGTDGGGKTTNLVFIRDLLEQAGIPLVVTREPGGTKLGERIRKILLDGEQHPIARNAELLLIFAARAQHLEQTIKPALEAGRWVLCDRFTDATYAYQGGGRGIPLARIAALEDFVQESLRPDLTLLLDIPIELGLDRVGGRDSFDRFEQEDKTFLEKVRQSYRTAAKREPARIRVIDASLPLADVRAQIEKEINRLIQKKWP